MPFPRRLEGRLGLCPLPWHQDEPAVHLLRQTAPLPAHPLFASRERYPNAEAALASTLVIGSQSYPLFAQPLEVVDAWADGFEKVWSRLRS